MTSYRPLADRMRPRTLDGILGQPQWLGSDGPIRKALEAGEVRSMVLWGPPGCGKTTIARVVADASGARFEQMSAVLDGVKELRRVVADAAAGPTVLFVDEIHRWNKAQQDALLPHVERGELVLIGATTENPSFSLIPALRSRLQIVRLVPLATDDVVTLLERALAAPEGLDGQVRVTLEALQRLATSAAGDVRRALTDLERAASLLPAGQDLDTEQLASALQRDDIRHDRSGEDHFNVVSAFIKSLRGSDPDAALYWLARLLVAGEDPMYVARRLIVFAAEDVGNADPRGLQVAVAAAHAVQLVGMPEARIPLAQATTWLAACPKSNASYLGIDEAMARVRATGALSVPLHLCNAPTADMRREGYGQGYLYPHDFPHHVVRQRYLPDGVDDRFYRPAGHGEEKTIRDRLAWWARKLEP